MPDYPDHQERPSPFENIITVFPANVAAYKSTAVHVDNTGGAAATVRATWYMHDAPSVSTHEDKTVDAGAATTLFFVNQGDTLDSVTVTGGGGGTTHSVSESNQLPLPASAAGGAAAFAGEDNPVGIPASPSDFPVTSFSSTDSGTFDVDGSGFPRILAAGFYQVGLWGDLRFTALPGVAETVTFTLRFTDSGAGVVGWSIEEQDDARNALTRLTFAAGVNVFQTAQRITVVSFTSAANFPVTITPHFTATNTSTSFRVQQLGVWGFRIAGALAASLSD